MQIIETLRPWFGRKVVRGAVVVAVLFIGASFAFTNENTDEEVNETVLPLVSVTTPAQFAGEQSLSLVGSVRAFSEAAITAEGSGRVTSVPVSLGDSVSAGQIIATLENASEQAAVLQAQGVYEAALASAEQSGVSVTEAEIRLETTKQEAISALRTNYTVNNSAIISNVDNFFSQPNSPIPGLRIGGQGNTRFLNSERVAYQTLLSEWKSTVDSIAVSDNLQTEIETAITNTQRTLTLVDTFLLIFDEQDDEQYAADEIVFTNLRTSLLNQISTLEGVQNSIKSAEENLNRAKLTSSGGTTSTADAQVKQALGSLRSAQASLAKTILRSPISGTVNSLSVRTGDFVNQSAQVAEVANNNALEIVTFISDSEQNLLSSGDEVLIENQFTGVVTQIAPAVDSVTRKTEVRIAAEDIPVQNGDTVTITKSINNEVLDSIFVPLSAVKFSVDTGVMFTVENGVLVEREVSVGVVRGGSVEITEGINATDVFVVDARGLQAGTKVEVAK